MRVAWLVLVTTACGRVDFDARGDGGQNASDAAGLCVAQTIVPANTPVGSSLVAAHTHDGYLALWSDPGGNPLLGMHLDDLFGTPSSVMVPAVTDPDLGGLADIFGMVYLLASGDSGGTVHFRSLQYDFTQQSEASEPGVQPVPHDTMISDQAHTSFVFADVSGTTALTRYFFGNAFATNGTSHDAGATISNLTGDDGPGDAHVGWQTTPVNVCSTGHVMFQTNPVITQDTVTVSDCHEMRIATGPAADDAIAIAYNNAAGELMVHYRSVQWDLGQGASVRIRFAAGSFWAAYAGSTGAIVLARLALDGTYQTTVTNIFPVGRAYTLVTDGTHIALLALGGTSLDIVVPVGC